MYPIYAAQVMLWSGNRIPTDFMVCAGQQLPVRQYALLYSIIGNTYGGNHVNFNLPNYQGITLAGAGQGGGLSINYPLSDFTTGTETVTLNTDQMPTHTHTATLNWSDAFPATLNMSADQATSAQPAAGLVPAAGYSPSTDAVEVDLYGTNQAPLNIFGTYGEFGLTAPKVNITSMTLGTTGGNQAHSNMQPYLSMYYIIAVTGVYPPWGMMKARIIK